MTLESQAPSAIFLNIKVCQNVLLSIIANFIFRAFSAINRVTHTISWVPLTVMGILVDGVDDYAHPLTAHPCNNNGAGWCMMTMPATVSLSRSAMNVWLLVIQIECLSTPVAPASGNAIIHRHKLLHGTCKFIHSSLWASRWTANSVNS